MTMATEDYAARDLLLVADTITGIRQFILHPISEGRRLTGPVFPVPWVDGENVAQCCCTDWESEGSEVWFSLGHQNVGALGVKCGFYACFEYENVPLYFPIDYLGQWPKFYGIIEGWGRVTVGTKGFRSEKARIKALISPTWEPIYETYGYARYRDLLSRFYPSVSFFDNIEDAVKEFPLSKDVG